MSRPSKSHAAAADGHGGRTSEANSPHTLAYIINSESSGATLEPSRRGSVVKIEEPSRDSSHDLPRPQNGENAVSHPASRRPSIAQVLSRALSNTSPVSEAGPEPRNLPRKSSRDDSDLNTFQKMTPLLIAISDGDAARVEQLLSEGTDTSGNPLQTAALEGDEKIVNLLLKSGYFDIDARDSRERTAIYAAASRGHTWIVNLLLGHNAKPLSPVELKIANTELRTWRYYESHHEQTLDLNRTNLTEEPEDSSGPGTAQAQLPAISRSKPEDVHRLYKLALCTDENFKDAANNKRRAAQRRGEWVSGPLVPFFPDPLKEIRPQQKRGRFPGFGFELPVVDFDFSRFGGHRVVSPTPLVDELLYSATEVDSNATLSGHASPETCRWYHLPANHLGWAEDLIRRIYENRSPKEQRTRDIILSREPFKGSDQDSRASLDPRSRVPALKAFSRNLKDMPDTLSTVFTLFMPFVNWETGENMAERNHVIETVRKGRRNDLENSLQGSSIPDMEDIQERSDWSKDEKMLCAYLYHEPPVQPRRTLAQFYHHTLQANDARAQDQVIARYYRSIWERDIVDLVSEGEIGFSLPAANSPNFSFRLDNVGDDEGPSPGRELFLESHGTEYSPPSEMGKAKLSTLDSKIRQKSRAHSFGEGQHVMVVDQLWLWILDDNTIITCSPQNWSRDDGRPTIQENSRDVWSSIVRYLALVNRQPLESVYDLAEVIVNKCLETFCKKSTPYGTMQILDVYESAIVDVINIETQVFNKFAAMLKQTRRQHQGAKSLSSLDELYNIDEEIELLREVRDIQDELHMLSALLKVQITVLQQAVDAMRERDESQDVAPESQLPGTSKSSNKPRQVAHHRLMKVYQMVVDQENRRRDLEIQLNAEKTTTTLNNLLDLKQKQANVSEARSARLTAESTKRQGNIMILFTLVTIIFSPLSLIATIFSLRVVEFPDILHLNYVVKYMFSIAMAVILPMFAIVVVYSTRLSILNIILRWKWPTSAHRQRKKRMRKQWEKMDGDYMNSIEVVEVKEQVKKRGLFWKKGVKKEAEDVEKGVANWTSAA